MAINSREKGIRGERSVIDWLQPLVDEMTESFGIKRVLLQRNTLQSDKGGFDIVGLPWLALEIKNVKADSPSIVENWWQQCVSQASIASRPEAELMPVLVYKTGPRRPWRVRTLGAIYDQHAGDKGIFAYCSVDVDQVSFERYFWQRARYEIRKKSIYDFE